MAAETSAANFVKPLPEELESVGALGRIASIVGIPIRSKPVICVTGIAHAKTRMERNSSLFRLSQFTTGPNDPETCCSDTEYPRPLALLQQLNDHKI